MRIQGVLFDGQSSKAWPAVVQRIGDNVILEYNGEVKTFARSKVTVGSRLGSAPRAIEFPGYMRFESSAHDEIDKSFGGISSFIHRLENDMSLLVVSLVALAVFCFASYMWIIPTASRWLVHKIPQSYIDELAKKTEGEWGFGETIVLAQPEQDKMDAVTARLAEKFPENRISITPVAMDGMANAFALPDGTMMVTDELLKELSTDEVLAVMMHEMGHVTYRHGLQNMAGQVIISALLFLTVGGSDITSIGQTLAGLSYSRAAEKESDLFAAKHLRDLGLKPTLLSDGLKKIERSHRSGRTRGSSKVPQFLSTHPLTEEREKYLKEL